MMAFILATDFDFIAYMSKIALFWKLFSRQWRFWNIMYVYVTNSFPEDVQSVVYL